MIAAIPLPYPFDTVEMQRALLACVAVGAFAPTIGAFLVQKRLSLVGDGVGHVAFAGVGLGLLLGMSAVWTALVFAVAGAIGVELLRAKKKIAGDLALALFFYAGIALGVVFAAKAGVDDLEIYLFGDPLAMTSSSLAAVVLIGGIVAVGVWSLRRVLFAIVTDEAWARAEGLPVDTLSVALAALTAAVIVAGMKVVGLLLVAALMVLPVASAQLLSRSFRRTVLLAAGIGAASAFVGLIVGHIAELSISGCIVLVAAAVFTVASVVRRSLPAAVESQV
ncbi:MAG TPA: metal ABC transporter permease [Actinomycetota bacterium]|nr:metal ABC transporter permease [Actinomycetota bacterium]